MDEQLKHADNVAELATIHIAAISPDTILLKRSRREDGVVEPSELLGDLLWRHIRQLDAGGRGGGLSG